MRRQNVYKNQLSRQTGSRHLTGPKTLPTIWYTYMTLVTKYQISAINNYWEKCDEKYLGRTDGRTAVNSIPPSPFGTRGYIKNEIETITFLNTIYLGIAAVLGDNVLIGGFIFINKCLEKNTDARRQGPIWYRPSIYFRLFSYFWHQSTRTCPKTCLSVFPYIFQAKYVRNKKINENKLVGGTTYDIGYHLG
jgi:hypothetical protein